MATDVSPSWSNAIAHPAGHRRRRGAGWLLSQGKLRQLRTCTDTVYPALRSDRFDPLEKACDSTMLASLSRTARAASQQFYAGFLSWPTHCPACLNRMGAGGPQGDATLAPPGAPRALNLGRCASTVRRTGIPPRWSPDSLGRSDGIPGSRGVCSRRRQPPLPPGHSNPCFKFLAFELFALRSFSPQLLPVSVPATPC